MDHFLSEFGLFFAKLATTSVSIVLVIAGITNAIRFGKNKDKSKIQVTFINKKYQDLAQVVNDQILLKPELKKLAKKKKSLQKELDKRPRRCFVLDFNGDIKASAVESLREEITAILKVAQPHDEVIVKLESGGGMVPHYGLAASQLQRVKDKGIELVVVIDKIAASGGYLMACVADRILAAPFAIIGSVGVVAQLPNFHHFLKKKEIDVEQLTAGEHKRTLTLFGKNTPEGRQKFQQDLEEIHQQFKQFIILHRPSLDIERIATGEHWLAINALNLSLIDGLMTSDDYLMEAMQNSRVYQLEYMRPKTFKTKLNQWFQQTLLKLFT